MTRAGAYAAPVAFALLLLNGCGHEGSVVREYDEVIITPPRPAGAAATTARPASRGAPQAAGANPLAWQAPPGWTEKPGSGMRLATFQVEVNGDAGDCSIVALAGDAGGLVPNVKRWIGQLGVEVPPPDALTSFLSDQPAITTSGGHEGVLIDLTALMEEHPPTAPSMLAGIITRGGQSIFVKLTGTKALLTSEREKFEALCTSLE